VVVNNDKRARLPTRSLVLARKPIIIDYWTCMREARPERFAFEIEKLVSVGYPLRQRKKWAAARPSGSRPDSRGTIFPGNPRS